MVPYWVHIPKRIFESIAGEEVDFVTEKGFSLTNGTGGVPELSSEEDQKLGIQKILNTSKRADLLILLAGGDEFTAKEGFF